VTEPLPYFLAFGAGIAAGTLNVIAAAGSLITLPILLFIGLPAAVANGTNRIAILTQNVVAVAGFRSRGYADFRGGSKLAAVTVPGAVVGALLAVEVPDVWFRRILAGVIVLAALGMFARPKPPDTQAVVKRGAAAYLTMFGIGVYGGFIQAGVGILLLIAFYHVLRVDLVRANMYKVFVVGVYTIPALIVFLATTGVAWGIGVVLAAGNGIGALIGTRIAVRGGEPVIRRVVGLVLLLMALRLVTW
jgi:uncharacterized membrane protein YfcA